MSGFIPIPSFTSILQGISTTATLVSTYKKLAEAKTTHASSDPGHYSNVFLVKRRGEFSARSFLTANLYLELFMIVQASSRPFSGIALLKLLGGSLLLISALITLIPLLPLLAGGSPLVIASFLAAIVAGILALSLVKNGFSELMRFWAAEGKERVINVPKRSPFSQKLRSSPVFWAVAALASLALTAALFYFTFPMLLSVSFSMASLLMLIAASPALIMGLLFFRRAVINLSLSIRLYQEGRQRAAGQAQYGYILEDDQIALMPFAPIPEHQGNIDNLLFIQERELSPKQIEQLSKAKVAPLFQKNQTRTIAQQVGAAFRISNDTRENRLQRANVILKELFANDGALLDFLANSSLKDDKQAYTRFAEDLLEHYSANPEKKKESKKTAEQNIYVTSTVELRTSSGEAKHIDQTYQSILRKIVAKCETSEAETGKIDNQLLNEQIGIQCKEELDRTSESAQSAVLKKYNDFRKAIETAFPKRGNAAIDYRIKRTIEIAKNDGDSPFFRVSTPNKASFNELKDKAYEPLILKIIDCADAILSRKKVTNANTIQRFKTAAFEQLLTYNVEVLKVLKPRSGIDPNTPALEAFIDKLLASCLTVLESAPASVPEDAKSNINLDKPEEIKQQLVSQQMVGLDTNRVSVFTIKPLDAKNLAIINSEKFQGKLQQLKPLISPAPVAEEEKKAGPKISSQEHKKEQHNNREAAAELAEETRKQLWVVISDCLLGNLDTLNHLEKYTDEDFGTLMSLLNELLSLDEFTAWPSITRLGLAADRLKDLATFRVTFNSFKEAALTTKLTDLFIYRVSETEQPNEETEQKQLTPLGKVLKETLLNPRAVRVFAEYKDDQLKEFQTLLKGFVKDILPDVADPTEIIKDLITLESVASPAAFQKAIENHKKQRALKTELHAFITGIPGSVQEDKKLTVQGETLVKQLLDLKAIKLINQYQPTELKEFQTLLTEFMADLNSLVRESKLTDSDDYIKTAIRDLIKSDSLKSVQEFKDTVPVHREANRQNILNKQLRTFVEQLPAENAAIKETLLVQFNKTDVFKAISAYKPEDLNKFFALLKEFLSFSKVKNDKEVVKITITPTSLDTLTAFQKLVEDYRSREPKNEKQVKVKKLKRASKSAIKSQSSTTQSTSKASILTEPPIPISNEEQKLELITTPLISYVAIQSELDVSTSNKTKEHKEEITKQTLQSSVSQLHAFKYKITKNGFFNKVVDASIAKQKPKGASNSDYSELPSEDFSTTIKLTSAHLDIINSTKLIGKSFIHKLENVIMPLCNEQKEPIRSILYDRLIGDLTTLKQLNDYSDEDFAKFMQNLKLAINLAVSLKTNENLSLGFSGNSVGKDIIQGIVNVIKPHDKNPYPPTPSGTLTTAPAPLTRVASRSSIDTSATSSLTSSVIKKDDI